MKDELKMILSVGLGTLVLIGVLIFLSQPPKSKLSSSDALASLVRDDSATQGPADSKVTLVEFADMQCPACATTYPVVKQVLQKYNGKIHYVFRHYPLVQHQNAEIASLAVEAAGKQNKFWDMQDKLFATQSQWENEKDPSQKFKEYAQSLGIKVDQFSKDLNDTSLKDKVNRDVADGNTVGVNATPSFYLNGTSFEKPITLENFSLEIDNLLK